MDSGHRLFGYATRAMLAVVIAAVATLLVFGQSLQQQVRRARVHAPFLVTRAIILGAGTDRPLTVPLAWSTDDVHRLTQGMESLGSVSGFSTDIGFVGREDGRHEQVVLARISADLLGYLSLPATCSPDSLYLYAPGHPVPAAGAIGRLDERAVRLLPLADSATLRTLVAARSGAVGLLCDPAAPANLMKIVFLPAPGKEAMASAALHARAAAKIWQQSDFAPATVRVESLSEAVTRRIEHDFGWLPPFATAFACLLVVILVGFALFDAARIRPEFQIRRAIGSSRALLLRTSAQRVARMLRDASALAVPLLALWWALGNGADWAAGLRGLGLTTALLLLAGALAATAHAAYVLARLDGQLTLTTNVAGSRWKTALVGICMGMMTFSLTVFAIFAVGLNLYFHQLQNTALGYAPSGLYAYAAMPVSARARAGDAASALLAEPLLALAPTDAKLSLICEGPWQMDALLADPNITHAGISLQGSAGLLGVLGIAHTGRDLSPLDLHDGTAHWLQSGDTEFLRRTRRQESVVGVISGVRVGALTPQDRSVDVAPLGGAMPCPAPRVLYRADARAAAALLPRLRALTVDYDIQPPREVSAVIAQARQSLRQLRDFANLGFAAAFLCMLLVASLTSAAYVDSRARIIAIRSALGESPWRAALDAVRRSALHALPALALAAAVAGWMQTLVRFAFPDYAGLHAWALAGLALALGAVIQSTMFAYLWKTLAATNFAAALRVD